MCLQTHIKNISRSKLKNMSVTIYYAAVPLQLSNLNDNCDFKPKKPKNWHTCRYLFVGLRCSKL